MRWTVFCIVFSAPLLAPAAARARTADGASDTAPAVSQSDLAELQAAAEAAAVQHLDTGGELRAKVFKGGQRSLQALNPEISIAGDLFGRLVYQDEQSYSDQARSGLFVRMLGLHFQANLDPFSHAKMTIGVTPQGVELGEAYITWTNITSWMSLTAGKFRQQFGVINRWHKPGLDQFDHPRVLTEHFGPGGLNQVGLAASLTLPDWWSHQQTLEVQLTNGMNERLFGGEFFSAPSGLLRLANYWDLNRNTYLEIGLNGLAGTNNQWGKPDDQDILRNDTDWRLTGVAGLDLTLNWEPVDQARYLGVTWRALLLYAYKETVDQAGASSAIHSWGAYSYLQIKVARNWILGVRGDITTPFDLDNDGLLTWAAVPYVTWWQSPWVRLRLQYEYIDHARGPLEQRALLQVTFAVGPHKHERY